MSWVTVLRAHEAVYRRAPSAHNSQPWTLDYRDTEVRIGIDPARTLPAGDPTGRDLALGLGAFVESCLIVAADLGLAVTADIPSATTATRAAGHPAPEPVREPSGPVSEPIRLVEAAGRYPTPFTTAEVAARRVARGPYEPGPLDPGVLADLEPGLVPVPARELAADLAVADRWLFGTPPVTAELRDWLRLTPRHPRYDQDGLTDRALELRRPEALFLRAALAAYPLTRRLGLPALLAATGSNLLRYDGAVLVQTADPVGTGSSAHLVDSVPGADLVNAGRRLLRTWLALARHGLAVHPLSQLIDCPQTAARLAERVGGRPLAVFRVGRPRTEPARSARLTGP